MIKKIFAIIGILLVVLVVILMFNTFTFNSKQIAHPSITQRPLTESSISHMQRAVNISTISYENDSEFDDGPFLAFHKFLAETYPLADSILQREVVNKYSLLYTWEGVDPAAKPIILMAHIDVVPVDGPT